MSTFFTADPHFGHANIIRYTGRPFQQPSDYVIDEEGLVKWASPYIKKQRAREMTGALIKNFNSVVGPNDDVYIDGDFAMGTTKEVLEYIRMLNGNLKFLWGNHDDMLKQVATIIDLYPDLRNRVKFLGDYHETYVQGQHIILTHYAMRVWNKSHHGSWNLYGHSHGTLADDPHALAIDIGVDCHQYKPISFEQVKEIMSKKFWQPIDHHRRKKQEGGGHGYSRAEYEKAQRFTLYQQLQKEFEGSTTTGLAQATKEFLELNGDALLKASSMEGTTAQLDARDINRK